MIIPASCVIYPGVDISQDVVIEDFCIIGCPPRNGEILPTIIGPGSVIRSHTVIYSGNIIGRNFQTGNKVNIRENNKIGDNVSIGTLSVIEHSAVIGSNVRIHSQAFIPEFTCVEENVWIGPNVVLTNSKYPASKNSKEDLKGIYIMKGAIIGANSTILPGIVIEEKTLIGAGSVVCKNTKASAVYAGNPAKNINTIGCIKSYDTDTIM